MPRAEALGTVGWLDGLHRNTALVVLVAAVLVAFTVWRRHTDRPDLHRWAMATAALAFAQIALGIVMAYVSLAPAAQVAHLTVASLLLGAEMVLLTVASRDEPPRPRRQPRQTESQE